MTYYDLITAASSGNFSAHPYCAATSMASGGGEGCEYVLSLFASPISVPVREPTTAQHPPQAAALQLPLASWLLQAAACSCPWLLSSSPQRSQSLQRSTCPWQLLLGFSAAAAPCSACPRQLPSALLLRQDSTLAPQPLPSALPAAAAKSHLPLGFLPLQLQHPLQAAALQLPSAL